MITSHDLYIHRHSFLHKWLPPVKLIYFLLLLLVVLTLSTPLVLAAYIFVVTIVSLLVSITPLMIIKRTRLLALFLLLVCSSILFTSGGDVFIRWKQLRFLPITVYYNGLTLSLFLVLRSLALWLTVNLLLSTSKVTAILHSLLYLRVPSKIAMLFFVSYRYIFRYRDDLQAMRVAARLRGSGRRATGSIINCSSIWLTTGKES
jgi:energy-coupling factor transporter transmembrane protein EcfT